MSNALLRVLTGLVGIPVILGLIYLGGWPFALLVMLAALIAQHELYAMFEARGIQPYKTAGVLLGALIGLRSLAPELTLWAWVGALLLVLWLPFGRDEKPLENLAATALGVLYPTALLTFLIALRLEAELTLGAWAAFKLTASVFILIWACDTLAYVVGKQFGKHPLAPRVSPKKTWEGTIGGALGAVGIAAGLKVVWLPFLAWPHLVVVALICGALSQLGDLAESRLKRAAGVKDSGALLPGHGGLLDRFDALIVAAPAVYLYLAHVAQIL